MVTQNPKSLLRRLLEEGAEREWLEFKHNNSDPEEIGRCISAAANASMLAGRDRAFIVWGIQNESKKRVGTKVRLSEIKKGNVNLANWLSQVLEPRLALEFLTFEDEGKLFSILTIDPAYDRPVRFSGTEYIRVGENIKPLRDFPEHERSLWLVTGRHKFESAIALHHQKDDDVLDKLDIDAYYRLLNEKKPATKEVLRKMCMLDFIRKDWKEVTT